MKIDSDLNKIHQNLYNKMQLEKDVARQEQEAQQLTSFLRSVKMNLYTNPNFYATDQGYQNAEAIKEYLRNDTAKTFAEDMLKTINPSLLFKAEGTEHTFEKVFASMQNMAYNAVENVINNNEELFRGGQTRVGIGGSANDKGSTYINLKDLPDDIARLSLKELQKYFGSNLKSKDQHFIYFNMVDQKVDNQSLSLEIKFKGELSPYAKRIYSLLLTRNFSLKNYYKAGIKGLETETLEIGNTTFFRSLVSMLQYAGLSYEEAIKYFYRGISAIEYHQDQNVIEHFNHLKTIYEFTGGGQKIYTGDGQWIDAKTVDFIVYNDPSSTEIQVISVKRAILDAIETLKSNELANHITYVVNRGKNGKYWKTS